MDRPSSRHSALLLPGDTVDPSSRRRKNLKVALPAQLVAPRATTRVTPTLRSNRRWLRHGTESILTTVGLVRVPIDLVHRRWSIPILAMLARDGGARFAAMRGQLGVSRDTLTSTLQHLLALGLVERTGGYGHPLRPEYIATPSGDALGPACDAVHQGLAALELESLGLKKWSLPIVGIVNGDVDTFSAIRRELPAITPRALSKSLGDLVDARVVSHADERRYTLGDGGRALVPPLRQLQRSFASAQRA